MPNKEPPFKARAIALPAEHGSWGLVIEPIALGLLVAPSFAGFCLGLGVFAVFLTRRPFKVALAERRRASPARGRAAGHLLLVYGACAVLGIAATFAFVGWKPLAPLLCTLPLVLVFLLYDLNNQSRAWQAELAGCITFAMTAASIALAGNWRLPPALALSAVLVGRAIPSVLYVRSRIRLERNRPAAIRSALALHAAALLVVAWMAEIGLTPWIAVAVFLALLARATIGLSPYRRRVAIRTIGISEMVYGGSTVLALAVVYWLQAP